MIGRAAKAEKERCVSVRLAPDTMTYVTALLPVTQGVSVYAALKRQADTLVERVTGRPAEVPEPIGVNLVISDQALLGVDDDAAVIAGYGPIPAAVARDMVLDAAVDKRSKATLRRLYATPSSGALVAMESRSRCFPRGLADFIAARDQRCRTPYCDAPIRHRDHVTPRCRGGRPARRTGRAAASTATTPRRPLAGR